MEQKYNIYYLTSFEIKKEDMDKYKYESDNIIDIKSGIASITTQLTFFIILSQLSNLHLQL